MSEYMCDHCLSGSVWVTSLKIMFSSSIYFHAKFKMCFCSFGCFFFLLCSTPLCTPHFFSYPFFDRGAFRLFLGSGYDKQSCCEQSWARVLVARLSILWTYTQQWLRLGLEEGCFLLFWEITTPMSKGDVPARVPTSNAGVLSLPHHLSSISGHWCFWSWPSLPV